MIGEDPEGMQIEVEDSGPGVSEQLSERLFTQGATTKGEGHGYGLAGVNARIQALGGHIRHTKRGERTVFEVSLPAPQGGGLP